MIYLESIQPLNKATIVASQDRPIIVSCDGLRDFYCKYHNHTGSAFRLFNEYIAASFMRYWKFNQPEFCFINVREQDVQYDLTIKKSCFSVPCFGVEKLNEIIDLNEHNVGILRKSKDKSALKRDILKLTFFDIWLANEDRYWGNFNIIVKNINGKFLLYPIDHTAIFNQRNLVDSLVPLTFDESLTNSSLFSKMLSSRDLSNRNALDGLKKMYYICITNCKKNLSTILSHVPENWGIDISDTEKKLLKYLFNDDWFSECWNTFLLHIQLFKNQI